MDESKHILSEDEQGYMILLKNGKPSLCPFIAPVLIPMKNNLTQQVIPSIHRTPCGNHCPMFRVIERGNLVSKKGFSAEINCCSTLLVIPIDEIQMNKPNSDDSTIHIIK